MYLLVISRDTIASLIGLKVNDPRSYGVADMVIGVFLLWFDLIGWIRVGEATGTPWNDDWSRKEVLVLVERDEAKVVAMDAIV